MEKQQSTNALVIPLGWFEVLSPNEAVLLAFLLRRSTRHADNKGWFICRETWIRKHFGFSSRSQTRLFRRLFAEGRVKVRYRGFPRQRFLKLTQP